MAAREVVGTIVRPDNTTAAYATVEVELVASETGLAIGWVPTADIGVGGRSVVTCDDTGSWSVELQPNSLIDPANTVYRVRYLDRGWRATFLISVPDAAGPHRVEDILSSDPEDLSPNALNTEIAARAAADAALDARIDVLEADPTTATALAAEASARAAADTALDARVDTLELDPTTGTALAAEAAARAAADTALDGRLDTLEADPTTQAAVDAVASDLAAHLGDTADAHDASAVSFTPAGTIAATDVQAAVAEVATDAASALSTHAADTTSVHGIADTSALLDTGDIGTTVQRRNRYDIRDYGAVCDRTTDDTAAVNAASDAAEAAGGGVVYIPGPTGISDVCEFGDGVSVQGPGGDQHPSLPGLTSGGCFVALHANAKLLFSTTYSRMHLHGGFAFDGAGIALTGIETGETDGGGFIDVNVSRCVDQAWHILGTQNAVFIKCTGDRNDGIGFHLDEAAFSNLFATCHSGENLVALKLGDTVGTHGTGCWFNRFDNCLFEYPIDDSEVWIDLGSAGQDNTFRSCQFSTIPNMGGTGGDPAAGFTVFLMAGGSAYWADCWMVGDDGDQNMLRTTAYAEAGFTNCHVSSLTSLWDLASTGRIQLNDIKYAGVTAWSATGPSAYETTGMLRQRMQVGMTVTPERAGLTKAEVVAWDLYQPDTPGGMDFRIWADGRMDWGGGVLWNGDVSLWRAATGTLAVQGAFRLDDTTTAGRPAAATVGAGATMFDTDLGQIIWSDGSAWHPFGTMAELDQTDADLNIRIATAPAGDIGERNVLIGPDAGHGLSGSAGTNMAVGAFSLYTATTAEGNMAFGTYALFWLTTGIFNTAIGTSAGQDITTENNTISIGGSSGGGGGSQAIAIGGSSRATADNTLAIGHGAEATAAGAVAIGRDSGGTPATTSTVNEIRLGTASHKVYAPGTIRTGSGITASRPTASAVGEQWFDTTLGKPIWWNGSVWKDAAGTTV